MISATPSWDNKTLSALDKTVLGLNAGGGDGGAGVTISGSRFAGASFSGDAAAVSDSLSAD